MLVTTGDMTEVARSTNQEPFSIIPRHRACEKINQMTFVRYRDFIGRLSAEGRQPTVVAWPSRTAG